MSNRTVPAAAEGLPTKTKTAPAQDKPTTLPGAVFALDATIWRAQHLAKTAAHLVAGETLQLTDYQGNQVCVLDQYVVEILVFFVNDLEDVCDKAAMQQETAMLLARRAS